MDNFSHTILGKFCAVILIAYYSQQNIIYGLLFCVVVIYYYQMTLFSYENFTTISVGDRLGPTLLDNTSVQTGPNLTPNVASLPQGLTPNLGVLPEEFEYTKEAELCSETKKKKDFINNYCVDDKLKYKELTVNPEMVEHVFPEIKTHEHSACNPCNPLCKFSVSNIKLRTEEEIVKPKNSNDYVSDVWNRIQEKFSLVSM